MTYMRTRVDVLGLAAYPAAFGLVLIANLTPATRSEDPILHGVFLPVHATFAFFGYAALFVAFTAGVMYLIQERELKSRAPRTFYYLVPSLERCDTLSGRSVEWGFAFLTLAIVTGLMWNHAARGRYWTWDPKEISTLFTATPTADMHIDPITYPTFGKDYQQKVAALYSGAKKDRAQLYNALVQSCANCHGTHCPGPLMRIKKMYVPVQ
jgi:hypothetical protein